MRNQVIFLVLLFLITFIVGCKEKIIPAEPEACTDIIVPGVYFPAFPKSWWQYRNQNNELIKYQISDEYQECEGKCSPLFLNLNKCIHENTLIYSWYCGLGAWCTHPSIIYSLNKDEIFICPISFSTFKITNPGQEPGYRRVTITIDTTLTVDNTLYQEVIVVKEYDVDNSEHKYFDYFSKNIGLIKRDSVNVNDTTELFPILILETYEIGN